MVISTRRMSKRVQEPVDQWLAKEGYFRKLTPRDPTCLFRAISEQVYHTQHYHLRVRKECTDFIMKKKHLFTDTIPMPFDYYLKEMQCFTEWGGPNEIRAMSLLYKRDIIIFIGEQQICENVTNNGFKKGVILLCHTEPKQYEPVYPMAFVQSAAYCQSIVYEVVYRYMYKMPDIKTVADKMLHNGNTAFRHDRFFQKGNLDIREQLIEDLYKKVKSSDTNEAQSDWKGAPPIPYKVAKALAPNYYRNIELDIWHELKREVKSAGWNRYNNNELQIGGRCVIEISINDLERCDRNNNRNFRINSSDCADVSESNNKIEQQKLKQGPLSLHGYIQEMNTNKEPVLVFIKDLGEKKFVPYDALKPFPTTKKNRQKNWMPINRNHSVNPDPTRRCKKSNNSFSRKRKDTINMVNETTTNTNKSVVLINDNNVDSDNINDINQPDFDTDEYNCEFSYVSLEVDQFETQSEHNSVDDCSNHATNERNNSLPAEVTLDDSQSTMQNNIVQDIAKEYTKVDAAFKKTNNTAKNKTEKFNHLGKDLQNSSSTSKMLDENYCPFYNDNSQINMGGNPNISYVASDNGNTYPFYPYTPGNFGEHNPNRMDHPFSSNFFYNLHLLHLEDTCHTLSPTYYGPVAYGPGHHGMQSLGPPSDVHMNNVPYIQEEVERFGTQNYSSTCNEETDATGEISNPSYSSINGTQIARQSKQGSKTLNGKDSLCQPPQKGKQAGIPKGNRVHIRQRDNRRSRPHFNQYETIPNISEHSAYNVGMHDMNMPRSQQHRWDPMLHQTAPQYTPPQYPSPNMLPSTISYHELPQHCTSEANLNPQYYLGSGNYVPMTYSVPPHIDVAENLAIPSHLQHFYRVNEAYLASSYSATGNPPMPYSLPMMYPQPMQYHALPSSHMQEQWNPSMLGPSPYLQCAGTTLQTVADLSSSGPSNNPTA